MADLSKIVLNEETYFFKDKEARDLIEKQEEAIKEKISSKDDMDIEGVLNFLNGLKINGISIRVEEVTEAPEEDFSLSGVQIDDSELELDEAEEAIEEMEEASETNTYIIFG